MLLRNYLLGKFIRRWFVFSLLLTGVVILVQLMQTAYLIFSLPPLYWSLYLLMLAVYSHYITAAVALPVAVADFVYYLKEERVLHVLYTFGVSHLRVLKHLLLTFGVLFLFGIGFARYINYQNIGYYIHFLKYKYGENLLLNIPPRTFVSWGKNSFYFEKRDGNGFVHFLMKSPSALATSQRARLERDGLILQNSSIFSSESDYKIWLEAQRYIFPFKGHFSYRLSAKRLKREIAFNISLYAAAVICSIAVFFIILKGRFGYTETILISFAAVVVEFIAAFATKFSLH